MKPIELSTGETIPESDLRPHLKGCGSKPHVYRGCRLVHPERIAIGHRVQIDEGVFVFGGMGVEIGSFVHLAFHSSISGGGRCALGDFAGIGAGVRLLTGTDVVAEGGLTNPTVPDHLRTVQRGTITIGGHAVLFTNCVVLPNVTIGEGCVVAAGAVVHHDLKPWAIYAGTPLVQVGVRPKDEVLKRAEEAWKSNAAEPPGMKV